MKLEFDVWNNSSGQVFLSHADPDVIIPVKIGTAAHDVLIRALEEYTLQHYPGPDEEKRQYTVMSDEALETMRKAMSGALEQGMANLRAEIAKWTEQTRIAYGHSEVTDALGKVKAYRNPQEIADVVNKANKGREGR